MIRLGKNIKALRVNNRYTRKALGKLLGVSETTIGNYESGLREPSIEKLIKLADLFKVSIDRLIRGENLDCGDNSVGEGYKVMRLSPSQFAAFKDAVQKFSEVIPNIENS